ncbi:reverse transcriptase [Senna tora]|uniref:Reverse transcriptase n=1 Tax=Senna tora TaxID=362788 RepID=A0A834WRI8_9FABA|nr:reverse transcriptase [Senna tora]
MASPASPHPLHACPDPASSPPALTFKEVLCKDLISLTREPNINPARDRVLPSPVPDPLPQISHIQTLPLTKSPLTHPPPLLPNPPYQLPDQAPRKIQIPTSMSLAIYEKWKASVIIQTPKFWKDKDTLMKNLQRTWMLQNPKPIHYLGRNFYAIADLLPEERLRLLSSTPCFLGSDLILALAFNKATLAVDHSLHPSSNTIILPSKPPSNLSINVSKPPPAKTHHDADSPGEPEKYHNPLPCHDELQTPAPLVCETADLVKSIYSKPSLKASFPPMNPSLDPSCLNSNQSDSVQNESPQPKGITSAITKSQPTPLSTSCQRQPRTSAVPGSNPSGNTIPPPCGTPQNYNWFPIHPLPQNLNFREIIHPPIASTIFLPPAEVTYTLFGRQNHCVDITIPQHLDDLSVFVTSSLAFETGTLNYLLKVIPTDPSLRYSTDSPPHFDCSLPPNMKILAWNVRGAANPDFRRAFRDIMLIYQPDAVILTETRISGEHAEQIISSLGFDNTFKVDGMGFAGGIWLLWNPRAISVEIISFSFQEIHCLVKVNHTCFLLTCLYASPRNSIRSLLWDSLTNLAQHLNTHWLLMGDFNDIARNTEKFGGRPPSRRRLNSFNRFLNSCHLVDLGFTGPLFTWTNNHRDGTIIRSRIDRAHANRSWLNHFPDSKVTHLPRTHSDHCPILLSTDRILCQGLKPFRLEPFWVTHPSFPNTVNLTWQKDIPLCYNLKNLASVLSEWNKIHFKNFSEEKKTLYKRLRGIQNTLSYNPSPQLLLLESAIQQKYNLLLRHEEELWHAKSRINWLTLGDRNTSYFHAIATHRRRKNKIHCLENQEGILTWDNAEIIAILRTHFIQVYNSPDQSPSINIRSVIPTIPQINPSNHSLLLRLPLEAEIKDTVFSLHPLKAPRRDGFHALFYQKSWNIVKDNLIKDIHNIFNSEFIPQDWSSTFITLIPKLENASKPHHFLPICLCSTQYKILTKLIANRIKPLLPDLISPTQGTFAKGKHTSDLFITAHEVLHSMNKSTVKEGWVVIKLDLHKAFDSISWNFISSMLLALNFPPKIINLILSGLHSATYSLLVNGRSTEPFTPSRGIRQDDILLFTKASINSCATIKEILDTFSNASGLQINTEKSKFWTSPGTPESKINQIALTLDSSRSWPPTTSFTIPNSILSEMLLTFFSFDHNDEDTVLWNHAKDGNFSIKSAYALISTPKKNSNASMSWTWKPFCNPRKKIFLWRASLNALPTSQKLSLILPFIPAICKLCNSNQEDLLHALRDCPSITHIWNHLPLPPNFFSLPIDLWLKSNCTNNSSSLINLPWNTCFIYVCYHIWTNRNLYLFKNKPHLPHSILKTAISIATEFHYVAKPTTPTTHSIYQMIHWKEPREHYHKLNIDGSASNSILGAGGIIRNSQGSYIISFCHYIGRGDSIKAELWALQTGLSIATDLNIKFIEIETDALSIIYLIKNSNLCHLHPFFCVILNCRRFLSTFDDYKITHIYREANGCADILVKHARISQCSKSTFLEPPAFLRPQLVKDSKHSGSIRCVSFQPP